MGARRPTQPARPANATFVCARTAGRAVLRAAGHGQDAHRQGGGGADQRHIPQAGRAAARAGAPRRAPCVLAPPRWTRALGRARTAVALSGAAGVEEGKIPQGGRLREGPLAPPPFADVHRCGAGFHGRGLGQRAHRCSAEAALACREPGAGGSERLLAMRHPPPARVCGVRPRPQMFIGDGAKMVRDAFALAKEKSPCIIFIDEVSCVCACGWVGGCGGAGTRAAGGVLWHSLWEERRGGGWLVRGEGGGGSPGRLAKESWRWRAVARERSHGERAVLCCAACAALRAGGRHRHQAVRQRDQRRPRGAAHHAGAALAAGRLQQQRRRQGAFLGGGRDGVLFAGGGKSSKQHGDIKVLLLSGGRGRGGAMGTGRGEGLAGQGRLERQR